MLQEHFKMFIRICGYLAARNIRQDVYNDLQSDDDNSLSAAMNNNQFKLMQTLFNFELADVRFK